MMKISDLNKIDIKDIDVAKLKNQLIQHRGIVAQAVLGVVSFLMAVSMFSQSQSEIEKYKSKIAVLKAKAGDIDQYTKTQNDVKDFLSKVPDPVSEDKIISLVTDLASKKGVKILTFTQAGIDKKNTLVTTLLEFSLVADSFSEMVRFMADIERGKDFLKILSYETELQLNVKRSVKENKNMLITFHIDVVSLKVEL